MGDKSKDKLISSKRAKEAMADRLTSTGMPLSLKDIYEILDGLEEVEVPQWIPCSRECRKPTRGTKVKKLLTV